MKFNYIIAFTILSLLSSQSAKSMEYIRSLFSGNQQVEQQSNTTINPKTGEEAQILFKLLTPEGEVLITTNKDDLNKRFIAQLSLDSVEIGAIIYGAHHEKKFGLLLNSKYGCINTLRTNTAHRSKGYGILLCAIAGKHLLDLGCREVIGLATLLLDNSMPLDNLINFYKKLGAEVVGSHRKLSSQVLMSATNGENARAAIYQIVEQFVNTHDKNMVNINRAKVLANHIVQSQKSDSDHQK